MWECGHLSIVTNSEISLLVKQKTVCQCLISDSLANEIPSYKDFSQFICFPHTQGKHSKELMYFSVQMVVFHPTQSFILQSKFAMLPSIRT